MAGMPGMTEEEMQAMSQPETPSVTTGADSHGEEVVQGPSMVMEAESVNWFVIGGFILLVAGSTAGAMVLKRNLARRMATGALAGAGALDV